MDGAYSAVRKGGLKFKGEKKKKKKKDRKALAAAAAQSEQVELRHGAFWLVTEVQHLVGNVLVETASGGYLTAVDDGTVTTALPRPVDNDPENMPEPQDIITMVKVSDTRVAFKTAYGRYISSTPDTGEVTARTEAMGVRELWEPMMQSDGVVQFRSADKKYLCAMRPGDLAHAHAESRDDPGVVFRVHSSGSLEAIKPKKRGEYEIVGGSLDNMEVNFAKKFQSYQNLCFKEGQTVKVSKEERRRLKEAKKAGKLHEEMLNRRSKVKADKFCK